MLCLTARTLALVCEMRVACARNAGNAEADQIVRARGVHDAGTEIGVSLAVVKSPLFGRNVSKFFGIGLLNGI